MKHFYPLTFPLFSFVCAFAQPGADQEKKFSLSLDSVSFEKVVHEIESASSYYFYYRKSDVDTLRYVTIHATDKSLGDILDQAFEDTPFQYTVHGTKVYVSQERQITTSLPVDFFRNNEAKKEDEPVHDVFAYMYDEKNDRIKTGESRLFVIGRKGGSMEGTANLAGHIADVDSGEPVIGALVYIEKPKTGVATDQFGYYSITLPKGSHDLKISSVGMKSTVRHIMLYTEGKLDIELKEDVIPLREIVVESEKDANVTGMQMGVEKLDIKTLKQVPTAFGEADILKVALTLPGVQSVGENSTGLNVRGGATDQNLILYNDAVIYNPSHLFGFFSAFNPDMLQNVELFKSGVPANYGGRLSSVLKISSREGNKKKFVGAGGIGLLTSRLSFEGPVIKDKLSFIVGGRSTYSNWLLDRIPNKSVQNSDASFYDLNAHVHYEADEKNTLHLSAYHSNDRFKLNNDTVYSYTNRSVSVKWKHIYKNKLYGVYTAAASRYEYQVKNDKNPVNAFTMRYDINQFTARADFNFFPDSKNNVDFGISSTYYKLHPGSFKPIGSESLTSEKILEREQALESAIYIGNTFLISSDLSLYAGVRYSVFNALGPKEVYTYSNELDRDTDGIIDTTSHKGIFKTYHGPELRASLRYLLGNNASVKLSYNRMRQYIHLLSNTTTMSPTDIWKLSDSYIRPQVGDQYSIGFYKNFLAKDIETSVEVYYKKISNFLDYRNGATLILNSTLETDVIATHGRAYGVEVMVKKQKGKLNGWISYTYSRSLLRTDPKETLQLVNEGRYYPSNFDKPHDFTLISNYQFSRRFSISFNYTYSTGRPVTIPLLKYPTQGYQRLHYSSRNEFRIPDYYRADLSVNLEGNHRVRKLAHSSWSLSVYNITGRKNAYSVYFVSEQDGINGYKLSIFGRPIPTLTYSFRF